VAAAAAFAAEYAEPLTNFNINFNFRRYTTAAQDASDQAAADAKATAGSLEAIMQKLTSMEDQLAKAKEARAGLFIISTNHITSRTKSP